MNDPKNFVNTTAKNLFYLNSNYDILVYFISSSNRMYISRQNPHQEKVYSTQQWENQCFHWIFTYISEFRYLVYEIKIKSRENWTVYLIHTESISVEVGLTIVVVDLWLRRRSKLSWMWVWRKSQQFPSFFIHLFFGFEFCLRFVLLRRDKKEKNERISRKKMRRNEKMKINKGKEDEDEGEEKKRWLVSWLKIETGK